MPRDPPSHRRSFPLYVGAGGIATATHYALTIVAVEAAHAAPLVASAAGFLAGSIVKYALNYSVAFRSTARHAVATTRFLLALALMLAANSLIFAALNEGLGLHYLLAQAITTVLLIAPGYWLHRQWVFRP